MIPGDVHTDLMNRAEERAKKAEAKAAALEVQVSRVITLCNILRTYRLFKTIIKLQPCL